MLELNFGVDQKYIGELTIKIFIDGRMGGADLFGFELNFSLSNVYEYFARGN